METHTSVESHPTHPIPASINLLHITPMSCYLEYTVAMQEKRLPPPSCDGLPSLRPSVCSDCHSNEPEPVAVEAYDSKDPDLRLGEVTALSLSLSLSISLPLLRYNPSDHP